MGGMILPSAIDLLAQEKKKILQGLKGTIFTSCITIHIELPRSDDKMFDPSFQVCVRGIYD